MKYAKFFFLMLAVAAMFCSCRKKDQEPQLSYYVTPNPYDIVSV